MGSKYLEYPSAGALGCISASFVAGTGWRRRQLKDPTFTTEVGTYLDLLWKFLKPVSFSLIGKEVDFKVLDGNIVLYGIIALVAGVAIRLVSGYFSFCGSNLNSKEKAYILLSGFPKATGMTKIFFIVIFTCLLHDALYLIVKIKIITIFFPSSLVCSSSCFRSRCIRFGTVPKIRR